MPIPSIGYIPEIPGRPKQVLPKSDWPNYAAIAALSTTAHFGPLGASAIPVLRSYLATQDIPWDRASRWIAPPNIKALRDHEYYKTPDEYQFYAAEQMSVAGGTLGLGCGLGKTLTAEVVAKALLPTLASRTLVLASTRTALDGGAWTPYIPRFSAMGYDPIFQVSIDSLHKFEPGFPASGGLLLLDEVHLLGGSNARRTKHALALRLKMDAGLGLSGTVFHGGILRAMNTLNLAIPGSATFASQWKAAEYFNCIRDVPVGDKVYKKIVKPEGDDARRFQEFISSRHVCALSKTSKMVLESLVIPEQDIETVSLDGPWGSIHYDSAQEVRRAMEAGEGIPHASAVAKKLARSGIDTKISWILDALATGEPLAVFAQYHESLDAIEATLRAEEIPFVRVDGGVTGRARTEAIARFQDSPAIPVFLGQFEAAGISVELTKARRSVATDISWRPDAYEQMLARTCRRGQAHRCVHYDLLANRFQEKILEHIRSGRVFDSSVTEYQEVQRATTSHQ